LIPLSPRADSQLDRLIAHFERLARYEAVVSLNAALVEASDRITQQPEGGLPAPRPYPWISRPGLAWIKVGRYWIAYRRHPRLIIAAIFYDTANIPRRL
jgi:plasmid stabilization system protein ParE